MTEPQIKDSLRGPKTSEAPTATVKILRVLEYVARHEGVSLTDVCRYTGMPKSTVVRLLSTLIAEDFVRRESTKLYVPAIKLWELGCQSIGWEDTRDTVLPLLKRLVQTTNETAHYAILDQGRAVYTEKVDGSHPVRAYTRIGGTSPAYATATGKVLLAWNTEAVIRDALLGSVQFTEATIAGADAFLRNAENIRHQGYAVNRGEWRSEVWGVAAPVFDRRHDVVGAIGLSGPSERIEPELERYAFYVVEAARDVSQILGASSKHPTGHQNERY